MNGLFGWCNASRKSAHALFVQTSLFQTIYMELFVNFDGL